MHLFIILNYELSYINAGYIIQRMMYCVMYMRLNIMPCLIL